MRVNTVNVIEMVDDLPTSCRAFTESKQGNQEAEKLFADVIKENGCPEKLVKRSTKDGVFEQGTYKALLIHASA